MSVRGHAEALEAIDLALAAPPVTGWAGRVNARNLAQARELTTVALMSQQRRVKLSMAKGAVLGNAAPVHLALRFVSELNESVVEVANRFLSKPYKNITDDVRSKLGLMALPPVAGSFAIELAAPPIDDSRLRKRVQANRVHTEEIPLSGVETVTTRAFDAVLKAIQDSVGSDPEAIEVERAIFALGAPGVRHLSKMAARSEKGDFSVRFDVDGEEEFIFKPSHAAWLRALIKNRQLDAEDHSVTGVLQTASNVRNWFDIVTDDGRLVSGTVDDSVRSVASKLYESRVRAVYRESMEATGESLRRILVRIEADEETETLQV